MGVGDWVVVSLGLVATSKRSQCAECADDRSCSKTRDFWKLMRRRIRGTCLRLFLALSPFRVGRETSAQHDCLLAPPSTSLPGR